MNNENLTVHLKVKDFNAWRTSYNGQEKDRTTAGITNSRVFRSADDQNDVLILADVAKKAMSQVNNVVRRILTGNGMEPEKANKLADALTCGQWTHDYPISYEEAQSLGMPVTTDIPEEIIQLMELYPQGGGRRPSVQYIPVPYPRRENQPPAPSRPGRQ